MIAEEVGGDGVADGDELNMGDTTGPEWDVGSMLVMQRGLVAASWVAGRRRVAREGTEREGRECRRRGSGGIEVEHETAVMGVDTSEAGDEAGVIGLDRSGDSAPQAPNQTRGGRIQGCNTCDETAVKRKRQFEGQPQLSEYQIGQYADNCGSKRRRVQDKKGEGFEDTNSMKKRLEGDDWIE